MEIKLIQIFEAKKYQKKMQYIRIIRGNKKYYPQPPLEECKYKIK